MENIVLVVVTALISGLLATIVTLVWQKKTAVYNRKMKIFETLMTYRVPGMIHFEDSVRALNSIDVAFYNDDNVRHAYSIFLDEAGKTQEMKPNLPDKHLRLLEVMAESLGLKKLRWDDIKRFYYPKGFEDMLRDNEILRKSFIMNNVESAKLAKGINDQREDANAKAVEHDS